MSALRATQQKTTRSHKHIKSDSRKAVAVDFLQLVSSGKVREAYRSYIADTFRHHNPYFPGDAESLMVAMEKNAAENPQKAFEVHHALEDGNLVAVHGIVRHKPEDRGTALVHIFRFEGDRIVELWDLGQEVPEEFRTRTVCSEQSLDSTNSPDHSLGIGKWNRVGLSRLRRCP